MTQARAQAPEADGLGPGEAALPRAVLWDLDGTLVDTEPYWMVAERELVESYGGHWSDEDALALVGNPLLVSAEYLRAHSPVTLPAEHVVEVLTARVVEQLRERVPWRPGVRELLGELAAARVPCALVTMSYAEMARLVTDALPPGTFAEVVTGDEVSRGKPDPEAYLLALSRLGVPRGLVGECVAIEDSAAGTAAAIAAGLPTLVTPCVTPVPERPGMVTVGTLAQVRAIDLRRLAGDGA